MDDHKIDALGLTPLPQPKILTEVPISMDEMSALMAWDKREQPRKKRSRALWDELLKIKAQMRELAELSAKESLVIYDQMAERLGHGSAAEMSEAGLAIRMGEGNATIQVIEVPRTHVASVLADGLSSMMPNPSKN
jgi:hypothetical protein